MFARLRYFAQIHKTLTGIEKYVPVIILTFLHFHVENSSTGRTGISAFVSTAIKDRKLAPPPAKQPITTEEFQGRSWPPMLSATTRQLRDTTMRSIPIRSILARASRNVRIRNAGGGIRSVAHRKMVTGVYQVSTDDKTSTRETKLTNRPKWRGE